MFHACVQRFDGMDENFLGGKLNRALGGMRVHMQHAASSPWIVTPSQPLHQQLIVLTPSSFPSPAPTKQTAHKETHRRGDSDPHTSASPSPRFPLPPPTLRSRWSPPPPSLGGARKAGVEAPGGGGGGGGRRSRAGGRDVPVGLVLRGAGLPRPVAEGGQDPLPWPRQRRQDHAAPHAQGRGTPPFPLLLPAS